MSVTLFSSLYSTTILALLALSFWVIYRKFPTVKSAQLWFYTYVFFAISMILLFYRGLGNENPSIVVTLNLLLYSCILLDYFAITLWVKKDPNYKALISITCAVILFHMHYLLIDDRIEIRVLIIRTYIMLFSFACCYQIYSSDIKRNIGHKLAAVFMLVMGLMNAVAFFSFIDGDLQKADMEVSEFYRLTSTFIATSAGPVLFCGAGIFYLLGLLLEKLEWEEENASIDPLTGVYNRRGFTRIMEEELNRSRRLDHPMTLAIVDIDHFKNINDKYGHKTGDEMLIGLSHYLKQELREVDSICRLGGEEFFLLLTNCNVDQAYIIIERIREGLSQKHFSKKYSKLTITGSFGISQANAETDDFTSIYERCDAVLYEAKRSGRNKTMQA